MTDETPAIDTFEKSAFSSPVQGGHTVVHDVYSKGIGPTIVVIQELPGIGMETLHLADLLIKSDYRVVLPHLFGPLGRTSMAGNLARVFCLRKEFHLFEKNRSSPIVDWLKALCQQERARSAEDGVGVIGMCLTGNFAMSLMADDSVLAAVAAQPSMPLGMADTLHMSNEEITALQQRTDATAPMLAYRFEGDWMCSAEKFAAIDQQINAGKTRVELNTLPGKGHSVLTLDFVDDAGHPTRAALDNIIAYFGRQLGTGV